MKNRLLFFKVLLAVFVIISCGDDSSNEESILNGNWAYESTILKFKDGNFEWTAYGNLQQRGYYDINGGILTITITNNYGKPQYLLGQLSRPYSINGNILTWGSTQYTKL